MTRPPAGRSPARADGEPALPRRIALDGHSLGTFAGGNESYVMGLLEGLADIRFPGQVVLYAPRAWPVGAIDGLDVVHHRLRGHGAWLRMAVELPVALRRDRPDLAHFQYLGPPGCPCPQTVAIHDTSFLRVPQLLPRSTAWRLRRSTGWAMRRAAAVLVPSTWTADTLAAAYPQAADKIHIAPLAAAACFRAFDGDPRQTPAAGGLPRRFLLYAGRRQRRKNVELLLRAYGAAARRDTGLPPLVLLGPPSGEDRHLRRLAATLGVGTQVVWRGYATRTDLAEAYRRADFLCYPCRFEGFGLPVVEAMSCGCPVLAADEGGLPETIGAAGLLLPPDSVSAWATAILDLTRDAVARGALAGRGPAHAARFSWGGTVTAWLAAARAAGR